MRQTSTTRQKVTYSQILQTMAPELMTQHMVPTCCNECNLKNILKFNKTLYGTSAQYGSMIPPCKHDNNFITFLTETIEYPDPASAFALGTEDVVAEKMTIC